jgi:hypothetical protein
MPAEAWNLECREILRSITTFVALTTRMSLAVNIYRLNDIHGSKPTNTHKDENAPPPKKYSDLMRYRT